MATSAPFSLYDPATVLEHPGTPEMAVEPLEIETYTDDCIEAGLVHTIHVSERRAFRNCRQRWSWAYLDDLHEDQSIRALEFGLAYHHAMEKFYEPATWHLPKDVLAEHAIAEFTRYTEDTYESLKKRGLATEALADDFADRLVAGTGMLRHYFEQVAPVADTFTPLKVEVAFEVPLLTPWGQYILCKCDRCWERQLRYAEEVELISADNYRRDYWLGLPVTIGGRLDLLARDNETGAIGILDWKTAGTLMQDKELDFLDLDDQIKTYLLAMWKLDIPATVFWYHEQWKGVPQRPEPYAGGRTIKGRRYQANKDLPTTYELYKETVEEGDPAGVALGAYDGHLAWLKEMGPRYWRRTAVHCNIDQLRAAEEQIWLEYLDMVSGRIYPSPERRKCTWCSFFEPCATKQRGGRYDHMLNTMYTKGRPSNDKNQPKENPK